MNTTAEPSPGLPFGIKDPASLAHIVRKERCRRYFRDFIEEYFPHHFPLEFGEHHQDIIDSIQSPKENKRIVRVMPRDSGKSTLLLVGAPAWWLARKEKWYIAMFGAGGTAFQNHYKTLQNELDQDLGNMKLLGDYPFLVPLMDFKNHYVNWNDQRMKVRSGALIEGRTMTSHVRGMKEGSHRPDVMIFDDPQDEDTVATEYQRIKFLNRFRTTLVNLIAKPGDIYLIGNFLHTDSLVATQLRARGWDGKLWRAENMPVDERDKVWPIGNTKTDGSALWEARWPLTALHARREEIGSRAYALEYLNKSVSDEDVIYDTTKFAKFHAPDLDLNEPGMDVLAFWDPSDPKENKLTEADYGAIAVVAAKDIVVNDRKEIFYWVLHCWLAQARVELQCEEALRVLQAYPIRRLFYEDNGGFGVLLPYLKRIAQERGIALPLKCFEQKDNKIQRIFNAEPTVKQRTFFADHLSTTFFTQWDEFPHGTHDDGPDAVVSALLIHQRGRRAFVF